MDTPFKAMSFVLGDTLTKDDMDQMQSNLQWLKDNTPSGRVYDGNSVVREMMTVVVSGRVGFGKSKKEDTVTKSVRFGRAFASNCAPNVTTGVVSDGERQIHCIVNGPGGRLLPNSTGCEIKIHVPNKEKAKWKIEKPFYVTWHAYGFRTSDMNDF